MFAEDEKREKMRLNKIIEDKNKEIEGLNKRHEDD